MARDGGVALSKLAQIFSAVPGLFLAVQSSACARVFVPHFRALERQTLSLGYAPSLACNRGISNGLPAEIRRRHQGPPNSFVYLFFAIPKGFAVLRQRNRSNLYRPQYFLMIEISAAFSFSLPKLLLAGALL